jgi:hypothetical protein
MQMQHGTACDDSCSTDADEQAHQQRGHTQAEWALSQWTHMQGILHKLLGAIILHIVHTTCSAALV